MPKTGAGVITLLPLRAGGHFLVIEVSRVIEVVAGSVRSLPVDEENPVVRAELHKLLDLPDRADRLIPVPLEQFSPFPPIAREQMRVDFLVGVVRLPVRGASWQESTTAAEPIAYLLDPARLARAAYL
jgi:hypothetical protein